MKYLVIDETIFSEQIYLEQGSWILLITIINNVTSY